MLPDTIKRIGPCAFCYCVTLGKIRLPERFTMIANGLFRGCTSLEELYIPRSVTQIGYCPFGDCQYEGCEENLTVICHESFFAHRYALQEGLKVRLLPDEG